MSETQFNRVDPATDYRHRLELVEADLAAVLARAAAAPAAREERDRCGQVAERILTKAHALVGRLASPSPGEHGRHMLTMEGERDPRPTGFGPLSWAWWPVVFAGWTLAAVVMGAEWVASGVQGLRERPGNGHPGAAGRSRTSRARSAVLGPLVAALALSALAACSPAPRPVTGDHAPNAELAKMRNHASAATTVDNPFWCPRRASP